MQSSRLNMHICESIFDETKTEVQGPFFMHGSLMSIEPRKRQVSFLWLKDSKTIFIP